MPNKVTPVFVDLETYWSATHSLSKMNPVTYCTHKETELISIAYKFDDDPTHCIFGEDKIKAWAKQVDWSDKLVIGHNLSLFDSMILRWRLGIRPKMWGCTLAMARPLHGLTVGGSLAKLVEHYKLGVKDQTALHNTKGRHLKDFSYEEINAMRAYNKTDVEQCAALFRKLLPHTPKNEMKIIDGTVRMLIEPKFRVDVPLLERTLQEERDNKHRLLLETATTLGADTLGLDDDQIAEQIAKTLGSSNKFAALLLSLDVQPPMKISPTTGKEAYALAKTDEGFIALTTHQNPVVAAAANARLGVKSTILESRILTFLEMAKATGGRMPIAKNYYGAHTGRFSGAFSANQENLPRVSGKLSDALRNSLIAPPGHKVVVADLSGIELRVNMYLWQVPYAMALFDADPEKADLYKTLASEVLGVPIEGMPKMVRQAGKAMHLGCFASDTKVFTSNGIKRIVDVSDTDMVWDGTSWVKHSGLAYQGMKQVISTSGVSATTDHEILTEHGWQTWGEVCRNHLLFQSALSLGSSPSSIGNYAPVSKRSTGTTHGFGALVVGKGLLTDTILNVGRLLDATRVPNKLLLNGSNGIGSIQTSCRMTGTERGCLTVSARRSVGVTASQKAHATTKTGVFPCAPSGEKIAVRSSNILSQLMGGISQSLKWIVSTTTKGMNRGISGLSADTTTCRTVGRSVPCREKSTISNGSLPVYDLLNCGPNSRFTVITDDGPIIVHNCGYGLGSAAKYVGVARQMAQLTVTEDEAQAHISGYRRKHPEIVNGWKACNDALEAIALGAQAAVDPWGLVRTDKDGFVLPSGRKIRYPNLRRELGDRGHSQWVFGEGRNKGKAYGGLCDENIVQALARDILMDNALEIKKRTGLYPCHTVHDELIFVVPEADAQAMLDTVQEVMRTPPTWFPALKTWSEGDIADSYGGAK